MLRPRVENASIAKDAPLCYNACREAGEMENQLGARIAKLRRACGLTQETLGGQIGVSAAAVSKWETGVSHS